MSPTDSFVERLHRAQRASGGRLCIGLDPVLGRLPAPLAHLPPLDGVSAFCTEIVAATAEVACAYKPNLAFFEALGAGGWRALEAVLQAIPQDRLVIADAKRGDIGSSARYYASAFFERLRCDAVTVSPYMGRDAIEPFLGYRGRAAFALVLTSNPGADDLQTLRIEGRPLYERVAAMAVDAAKGHRGTVGFVVGATRPEPLAALREAYPQVPFLVPGVGAQGGDAEAVMAAAGSGPLLVNAGRAVTYASHEADFARAARRAAERLRSLLPAPAPERRPA